MTEDWKFQVTFRFGAPDNRGAPQEMLNVRAMTEEEFINAVRAVNSFAGDLYLASETVRAGHLANQPVGTGMGASGHPGGQPVQQPAQQPAQPPEWARPAQPTPPQAVPQCAHGAMSYRTGEKNGRQWAGWFCPAPDGQPKCAVQWVNNK